MSVNESENSAVESARRQRRVINAFVTNCVDTVSAAAHELASDDPGNSRGRRIITALTGKQRALVTCHAYPDPDALAACCGMIELLHTQLPDVEVDLSVKGRSPGGLNDIFLREFPGKSVHWQDLDVAQYDAVVLLDTHPGAGNNPLPDETPLTVVVDHHQRPGDPPALPCYDVRPEVGATCSIIFSYFMQLDVPISPTLAALLLFGIETDLDGAAAQPTGLDNMALASLTLMADARKLYRMRHADLPQAYMQAYHKGLRHCVLYGSAAISHLDQIDSPEQPAVIADFLMRWDACDWLLITAAKSGGLLLSLRTKQTERSAADVMKRLVQDLGEGGGHRNKAGGVIPLKDNEPATIQHMRKRLRRRLLEILELADAGPVRLIDA